MARTYNEKLDLTNQLSGSAGDSERGAENDTIADHLLGHPA